MSDAVIDDFCNQYEERYSFFRDVATYAGDTLRTAIEQNGIKAIVSSRPKSPTSLHDKLVQRNAARPVKYASADDISRDLVDLAGVRVALYFPSDVVKVDDLVRQLFDVTPEGVKRHPVPPADGQGAGVGLQRFPGYAAIHYRTSLKAEALGPNRRLAKARIEVQVASLLMHAWSEVNHDLRFKPPSGKLSEDEVALLDNLNGLVHNGEALLEAFQRAMARRLSESQRRFGSHYELAAFLYALPAARRGDGDTPEVGRADLLFRFLKAADLDGPALLAPHVCELPDAEPSTPLVQRVATAVVAHRPDLAGSYQDHLRGEFESAGPVGLPAAGEVDVVRVLREAADLWETKSQLFGAGFTPREQFLAQWQAFPNGLFVLRGDAGQVWVSMTAWPLPTALRDEYRNGVRAAIPIDFLREVDRIGVWYIGSIEIYADRIPVARAATALLRLLRGGLTEWYNLNRGRLEFPLVVVAHHAHHGQEAEAASVPAKLGMRRVAVSPDGQRTGYEWVFKDRGDLEHFLRKRYKTQTALAGC